MSGGRRDVPCAVVPWRLGRGGPGEHQLLIHKPDGDKRCAQPDEGQRSQGALKPGKIEQENF